MSDINLNETAKMIRETLKAAFPKTKFSVRSRSYSGGSSIHTSWTDGPAEGQIQSILDRFEGRGFDGMTDCSYYCGERMYKGKIVNFCGAYVTSSRNTSIPVIQAVADRLAYDCGLNTPVLNSYGRLEDNPVVPFNWHDCWIKDGAKYLTMDAIESPNDILAHDRRNGETLSTLVHRVLYFLSFENQQSVELPEYLNKTTTVETGRAAFKPKMQMFPKMISEKVN